MSRETCVAQAEMGESDIYLILGIFSAHIGCKEESLWYRPMKVTQRTLDSEISHIEQQAPEMRCSFMESGRGRGMVFTFESAIAILVAVSAITLSRLCEWERLWFLILINGKTVGVIVERVQRQCLCTCSRRQGEGMSRSWCR